MYKRLCRAVFAVLLAGGAVDWALAQTPDGETPPNEGVCDPLRDNGATSGLYGLCVAFCEAQDCQPDFSAENPFAGCTPSSQKLLDIYNRKKGAGDPDMPCVNVQPQECPCWTQVELDGLRYPVPGDPPEGDTVNCADSSGIDSWTIQSDAYRTSVSTFDIEVQGSIVIGCSLQDQCDDGVCLGGVSGVSRFVDNITPEQHEICRGQVISSGQDRGFGAFCWQ